MWGCGACTSGCLQLGRLECRDQQPECPSPPAGGFPVVRVCACVSSNLLGQRAQPVSMSAAAVSGPLVEFSVMGDRAIQKYSEDLLLVILVHQNNSFYGPAFICKVSSAKKI